MVIFGPGSRNGNFGGTDIKSAWKSLTAQNAESAKEKVEEIIIVSVVDCSGNSLCRGMRCVTLCPNAGCETGEREHCARAHEQVLRHGRGLDAAVPAN